MVYDIPIFSPRVSRVFNNNFVESSLFLLKNKRKANFTKIKTNKLTSLIVRINLTTTGF